jgi:AcrR family transcriptional regulator
MRSKLLALSKSMAPPEVTQDGRVARRLDNRERILRALYALIRSGRSHPTLREVAANAGVTPRTLLNHFPDMGALVIAGGARWRVFAEARLATVSDDPDPEVRVRDFFKRAASFFDGFAAVRWSTLTFPGQIPGFDPRQNKGFVLGLLERRVAELLKGFDVEIERDHELRQALLVMIDPLAWRLLRVQQGLSRNDAAASMARGVIALARSSRSA